LESFLKLLAIPLLFFQYMRSPRGQPVLLAFVGSVALLMAVSWLIHFFPQLPIHRKDFGVPAHDRILLSEVFVICAFCLAPLVIDAWQAGARWRALMFATLIGAWLLNVVYVTTARSAVVVILALALALGWRHATWRGIRVACIVAFVLGMSAWSLSHQIRERIGGIATEIGATLPSGDYTSAYSRVMFWIQSVELIRERPILGHGTGSIRAAFRRVAPDPVSAASNPHNQIFATGIQLGAVGIAALLALWLAHLLVFRGHGLVCWFGLVMVVQNIVASLFNSHLFDFGQGWFYVFGVGVLGGIAMREPTLAVPPEA
jgi:O-antigen ligase